MAGLIRDRLFGLGTPYQVFNGPATLFGLRMMPDGIALALTSSNEHGGVPSITTSVRNRWYSSTHPDPIAWAASSAPPRWASPTNARDRSSQDTCESAKSHSRTSDVHGLRRRHSEHRSAGRRRAWPGADSKTSEQMRQAVGAIRHNDPIVTQPVAAQQGNIIQSDHIKPCCLTVLSCGRPVRRIALDSLS